MVTGDKDIFMLWEKHRDGAAPLYRKPMMQYDKLVEIYANDLAKGSKVKGPGDQSDTDEDNCNKNEVQPEIQVADESTSQVRGTNNSIPSSSRQSLKLKESHVKLIHLKSNLSLFQNLLQAY